MKEVMSLEQVELSLNRIKDELNSIIVPEMAINTPGENSGSGNIGISLK